MTPRSKSYAEHVEADPVTAALEVLDSKRREAEAEAAAEQEGREAALQGYVTILRRRGEPAAGDGEELASLIGRLGFDAGLVAKDIAALDEAQRLQAWIARRAELRQAILTARRALRALRKRHKEELYAAEKGVRTASNKFRCATQAVGELQTLRARNRHLFPMEVVETEPAAAEFEPVGQPA